MAYLLRPHLPHWQCHGLPVKKRLRKKLGVGEFSETVMAFQLIAEPPRPFDNIDQWRTFTDVLHESSDQHGLLLIAGPSRAVEGAYDFTFYACSCRRQATRRDRRWAQLWLRERKFVLHGMSPLMDVEKLRY